MSELFQRTREVARELDDVARQLFILDIERRGEGLRQAVEAGWYSKFLLVSGLIGAELAYIGNEGVSGFGKGVLAMSALHGAIIYGPRLYRRLRGRSED